MPTSMPSLKILNSFSRFSFLGHALAELQYANYPGAIFAKASARSIRIVNMLVGMFLLVNALAASSARRKVSCTSRPPLWLPPSGSLEWPLSGLRDNANSTFPQTATLLSLSVFSFVLNIVPHLQPVHVCGLREYA